MEEEEAKSLCYESAESEHYDGTKRTNPTMPSDQTNEVTSDNSEVHAKCKEQSECHEKESKEEAQEKVFFEEFETKFECNVEAEMSKETVKESVFFEVEKGDGKNNPERETNLGDGLDGRGVVAQSKDEGYADSQEHKC